MTSVTLYNDNCLTAIKELPDNSVDSIVTDPPYGISFMAKKWDYDVPSVDVWRECLRVLKPGGHMLVACGTRTQHRMVAPIEDAGFEIRDVITWLYGSGFPKSLDVSKAIDKEAGATREVVGVREDFAARHNKQRKGIARTGAEDGGFSNPETVGQITAPATDAAREWEGWGTALKPACEFWTLCRKPLSESTVAKNVLKWGTGALNIDGCRVRSDEARPLVTRANQYRPENFNLPSGSRSEGTTTQGRFPANLILDEEAAQALDAQTEGTRASKPSASGRSTKNKGSSLTGMGGADDNPVYIDSGGASRFFYIAKSSKKDRGEGNIHPTVKPTALMAYLCKLITPPGGTVLDPFMGSGSTGVATIREKFNFIGIDLDETYVSIAENRIKVAKGVNHE